MCSAEHGQLEMRGKDWLPAASASLAATIAGVWGWHLLLEHAEEGRPNENTPARRNSAVSHPSQNVEKTGAKADVVIRKWWSAIE